MIPKVERTLDLTQPLFHGCPGWPTHDYTNIGFAMRHATHGCIEEWLSVNVHTATHIDAPYHFLVDGGKVDEIDKARFSGRAAIFDLRNAKDWLGIDPVERSITAADLENCGVDLKDGDIVLLHTGWGETRNDPATYVYNWPYISEDGAQWLVDHNVKTVLTDGISVGGWPEGTGAPPHRVLLGANVLVVEEVYMDPALYEEEEWFVVVLPLLLKGAGGAPTRVIAMKFA